MLHAVTGTEKIPTERMLEPSVAPNPLPSMVITVPIGPLSGEIELMAGMPVDGGGGGDIDGGGGGDIGGGDAGGGEVGGEGGGDGVGVVCGSNSTISGWSIILRVTPLTLESVSMGEVPTKGSKTSTV